MTDREKKEQAGKVGGADRELTDAEMDKVTGGDHGGGGRRISSWDLDYRWDESSGTYVPR